MTDAGDRIRADVLTLEGEISNQALALTVRDEEIARLQLALLECQSQHEFDPADTPLGVFAENVTRVSADISWTDVADEDHYEVELSKDGLTWTVAGTTVRDDRNITLDGLLESTAYHVRVVAYNEDGTEGPSEPFSFTTAFPPIEPPPPTGTWLPPTKAISIPWTAPTPDIVLEPGASVRAAYIAGHRKIKLKPGEYGAQSIGAVPGATIWCDVYAGAHFDANFVGGAFQTPSSNSTIVNLWVERYNPSGTKEGDGMIDHTGATNQRAINCKVGRAKNAAYTLKGTASEVGGGEIYQCGRYGWGGGGNDTWVHDLWVEEIRTGVGVPRQTSNNSGLCKNAFSRRWRIQRIAGKNIGWNVIWFDIQNEPSLVEDIYIDGTSRAIIFLEVSFGGDQSTGEWKTWRFNNIGGVAKGWVPRAEEGPGWPIPAVIQISATPDVVVNGVYGKGFRTGVAAYNDGKHPQLVGLKDGNPFGTTYKSRNRCGINNITIVNQNTPDTIDYLCAIFGAQAPTFTLLPSLKLKPATGFKWQKLVANPGDKFRDFGGDLTEAAFRTKYVVA